MNRLSVRRVKVQTLDENGKPEGQPMFGVMAADDFTKDYNDTFTSFEDLNNAINEYDCILKVVDPSLFGVKQSLGTDNYYGETPDED
jgi:hypothetical protein